MTYAAEVRHQCVSKIHRVGVPFSPVTFDRELWATLMGYNLIRTTAAGAALLHGKQARQISFTSTCQYVLASWMLLSCGLIDAASLRRTLPNVTRADGSLRGRQPPWPSRTPRT